MSKPKPCEKCGTAYHQPYEDGLVECVERLVEQRDDTEAETVARIVAWLRDEAEDARGDGAFATMKILRATADAIARSEWKGGGDG